MINNLDRIEFGETIGHHWSSIQQWELNEIYPKPNTIKDICDTFNADLKYFGYYYYWIFNNPGRIFKEFKENEDNSYAYYAKLFNVSDSTLKRIASGKIELSYSMYLKFKEIGVFKELNKKKPINYDDIPIKFKAWKKKIGYTNAQCGEISNASIATVKRLAIGKTKGFPVLYQRLKELRII